MNIALSIKDIENKKKKIEQAEKEAYILTGKIDAKREELKTKYGVDTLEEAYELIKEITEELEITEKEIKDLLTQINDAGV